MQPTVGRIVHVPMKPTGNNGADIAAAVITRVWNDNCVNVKVLTDGPGIPWRTSVVYAENLDDTKGTDAFVWTWPPRV